MVGNRTVVATTRSKKLSKLENPPARKKDRKDNSGDDEKGEDVNVEYSSSSTSTSSESEAVEEASDHSAEEQREDSDDEEIRLLFEQKVENKAKKSGGKNERTEGTSRTSGVKKMNKGKKLKKKIVEEEDEKENERGEGSSACKFPMNRIYRIMKDQDSNMKIAQEAILLTNKASEKFLELYCKEAYACSFLDHKNQVAYDHLASVVSKRQRFDFLTDIVPERIKAEDALAELPVADK